MRTIVIANHKSGVSKTTSESPIKPVLRAASIFALVLTVAPCALSWQDSSGQTGGFGRSGGARPETDSERRARDRRDREFNLRMAEKAGRRPVERHEPRMALTQIREDFTRIQVINEDLMRAASQTGALDPRLIAKSASEIKKRAERLKYNLALPEPEKATKRPVEEIGAEVGQLKSALSELGKMITGFVTNPAFVSSEVVDTKLAAQARRDLEGIIELSSGIKKCGEKLSKVAQK